MTTYFKLALLSLVLTISPWAFGQTQGSEESPGTPDHASDTPAKTEVTSPAAPAAEAPAPAPEEAPATTAATTSQPAAPEPTPPPAPVAAPSAPPAPPPPPPLPAKPRECKWEWVRDGFYLRMLTTMGFASMSGDGPTGSARISGFGSGGIIAIGASLTKGLVLAANLQSSVVSSKFEGGPFADATFTANGKTLNLTQKATGTVSGLGVLVDWYPMQDAGLHVRLGGGVGFVAVSNQADESYMVGRSASGTLVLGYDWAVSPNWALGLAFVISGSTSAKLKYQDTDEDSGYKLSSSAWGISASILYF
jgi:hypothetical protein